MYFNILVLFRYINFIALLYGNCNNNFYGLTMISQSYYHLRWPSFLYSFDFNSILPLCHQMLEAERNPLSSGFSDIQQPPYTSAFQWHKTSHKHARVVCHSQVEQTSVILYSYFLRNCIICLDVVVYWTRQGLYVSLYAGLSNCIMGI